MTLLDLITAQDAKVLVFYYICILYSIKMCDLIIFKRNKKAITIISMVPDYARAFRAIKKHCTKKEDIRVISEAWVMDLPNEERESFTVAINKYRRQQLMLFPYM